MNQEIVADFEVKKVIEQEDSTQSYKSYEMPNSSNLKLSTVRRFPEQNNRT
jgi:hypothetical protein